jgi:uncharacterized HhH-GPD family protein
VTSALYFTGDDEANALLAQEPLALLIGFALDQQVPVQTAFAGPLKIKQRVGTLDARTLAETDLEPVFKEKPAVHRFPGSMAKRVQELAAVVEEEYGGRAERVWTDATDGADLRKRIGALPGLATSTHPRRSRSTRRRSARGRRRCARSSKVKPACATRSQSQPSGYLS